MTKFDPKLEEAMAEIAAVIHAYDVGGFVTLCSPTHTEYRLFIEPSWAATRLIEKEGKQAIHWPLRASHPEKADMTGHLIFSIRDTCSRTALGLQRLYEIVGKDATVEHYPFGRRSG